MEYKVQCTFLHRKADSSELGNPVVKTLTTDESGLVSLKFRGENLAFLIPRIELEKGIRGFVFWISNPIPIDFGTLNFYKVAPKELGQAVDTKLLQGIIEVQAQYVSVFYILLLRIRKFLAFIGLLVKKPVGGDTHEIEVTTKQKS